MHGDLILYQYRYLQVIFIFPKIILDNIPGIPHSTGTLKNLPPSHGSIMKDIQDYRARFSFNIPLRLGDEIRRRAFLVEGEYHGNTSRMAEKILIAGLEALRELPPPLDVA